MLQNLQQEVQTQADSLQDLEHHVTTLSTNVSEQGRLYDDLSQSVGEQRAELQRAMEAYDLRLSQQEKLIRDQDDVLKRLLSVRFRIDFVVDLVIMAIGYVAASSKLVVWPATLIAALIFPSHIVMGKKDASIQDRRRRQNNARMFLLVWRLTIFIAVIRYCRYVAVKNGLHNMVGDYRSYFAFAKSKSFQMVKSYWSTNTSISTPTPTLPLPSSSSSTSGSGPNTLSNLSDWSFMDQVTNGASKLWESAGESVINFVDGTKKRLNSNLEPGSTITSNPPSTRRTRNGNRGESQAQRVT